MQDNKRFWEVPEVDLNLRHYSGHPSDAIKLLKRNIEHYLRKPDVSQKNREVYSAIYNALNYYKSILYSSASDFSTGPTFLNHSLMNMKKDYDYLSQKYNSTDITTPPVITMNGRIKSPISAIEKIKDKVEDYLQNGTDLRALNESLRDFMGVRIIVDPPQNIKDFGKDAENEFLQNVLIDLLRFHGITGEQVQDVYKFIPINTKNHPHKLESMLADGRKDHLPNFLSYCVKNYVDHPKKSGYQSYHICATPEYSSEVKKPILPPYIIPPTRTEYSFEYQVRTKEMDEAAEHGSYSHDNYKCLGNYHRLAIPFYIELKPEHNRFKSLNLEESCEKHFGFVPFLRVYDPNGNYLQSLTLVDFRDLFTSYERDAIIDGRMRIHYFPNHGFELADTHSHISAIQNSTVPVFLSSQDIVNLKASEVTYADILEQANATDCMITSTGSKTLYKPEIELYVVETSEDRQKFITKPDTNTIQKDIPIKDKTEPIPGESR